MVLRANESEDAPQIIVRWDDLSHGWHRSHDVLQTRAGVTLTLQRLTPECDQPEERVIIAAIDPHAIRQRWTNSSSTCAAMTTAASHAVE